MGLDARDLECFGLRAARGAGRRGGSAGRSTRPTDQAPAPPPPPPPAPSPRRIWRPIPLPAVAPPIPWHPIPHTHRLKHPHFEPHRCPRPAQRHEADGPDGPIASITSPMPYRTVVQDCTAYEKHHSRDPSMPLASDTTDKLENVIMAAVAATAQDGVSYMLARSKLGCIAVCLHTMTVSRSDRLDLVPRSVWFMRTRERRRWCSPETIDRP